MAARSSGGATRSLAAPRGAPPAARAELGRGARRSAPRSSHGDWEPSAERDDPVTTLERESSDRVAELVPLRFERMLASPFAFYRGSASIMAADLAATPVTGLRVQLCGDAHLANFGAFAAPDRRLVFDLNDFDETLPGPWEWDVKRLAASFEVAARDRDFKRKRRRSAVAAAVAAYRNAMRELASRGHLDVWYLRLDLESILDEYGAEVSSQGRDQFRAALEKARGKGHKRAFDKLVRSDGGELRFVSDPPLIVPFEDMMSAADAVDANERFAAIVASYRRSLTPENRRLLDGYTYLHGARKVVGVGSVGTRTSVALFIGRDESDPLILQIKEAGESVLEPFAGRARGGHHGRRVVEGQRLMQTAGDILLGWMSADDVEGTKRAYYVRQLWDQKASARLETIDPPRLEAYARMCGATLARAHARSGDRIAIAAYLGSGTRFDEGLVRFAEAYADRNQADFEALQAAVRSGRVWRPGGGGTPQP